jgi:hypothetical protein
MTTVPAWLDELDLRAEPPWLTMGLNRSGALFLPDDDEAQVAERAALLAARPADVVAVLDGQPPAGHALLVRGRRGQDDVCALRPDADGVHRMVGAVLCFPSHWVLGEKLGLPVAAVHGPVPGYVDALQTRVDSFLARRRPGQVAARRNRTLHERGDLYAPMAPRRDDRPLGEWWLRSERQALALAGESDVVAFTIRTQQVRLDALPAAVAHRLAETLAAEPDELGTYRGYLDVKPALVRYLATR